MSLFLPSQPRLGIGKHPEVSIPASQAGEPIAYMFGTFDMKGTCIYPYDAAHMQLRKTSTGSGDKGGFGGGYATGSNNYFMNFGISYCWGLVSVIERIKIDSNIVWLGPLAYDPSTHPHGFATLSVAKYGLKGVIRFYFGTSTQLADNPPVTTPPTLYWLGSYVSPAPAWSNLCYAFFSDFQVGSSPTVPKLTIRARRCTPDSPLTDTHKEINTGQYREANPAHVLAEIFTHPRYGAGLPVSRLDMPSWNACAATLAAENVGISGQVDRLTKVQQFSEDVRQEINAVFVRRGPQWGIKLIRRDYSFANVPLVPEDQINNWRSRPHPQTDVVTQLTAEYPDQDSEYKELSVTLPNSALVLSTGNNRRESIKCPHATANQVAIKLAVAQAPLIISPPDHVEFELQRSAGFTLEEGDVIRPLYPKDQWDGSRVLRILTVERPVTQTYLKLTGREEMAAGEYGETPTVPNIGSIPPDGGGGDTGGVILDTALPDSFPMELPWDLSRTMQVTELATRGQLIYTEFQLLGGTLPDVFNQLTASGMFAQGGTLAAQYSANTLAVDDGGLLLTPGNVTDLADWWTTQSVTRAQLFQLQRLLVIADPDTGIHEICAWQTIAPASAGNYKVSGIIRGLFDTRPLTHASGLHVFLMGPALPFVVDRLSDWANGVTLHLKAVPYNASDSADAASMPTASLGLTERALRPFAVSTVLIDGVGGIIGATYSADATVRISWIPLTRGAGFGYNNAGGPWDPGIAAEGDFVVRIYAANGTTLLRTFVVANTSTFADGYGVQRTYQDYTPASDSNPSSFVVAVNSRVNGWESLITQKVVVTKL